MRPAPLNLTSRLREDAAGDMIGFATVAAGSFVDKGSGPQGKESH